MIVVLSAAYTVSVLLSGKFGELLMLPLLFMVLQGWCRKCLSEIIKERQGPFCIRCGYNLVGSMEVGRCPECGWRIDPEAINAYRFNGGQWD